MKKSKKELTIVTGFFDVGRENFKSFARSNDKYAEFFKFWARIKNELVVYTDKYMAEKVKEIRKQFGLLDKTKIVIIDDCTTIEPKLYEKMVQISHDQTFLTYRYMDNPADNNAKYDYVMLLKAWCVKDAVEKGYAKGMVAWLDFGFNHGGIVYSNPEEFDFLWETDAPDNKITMYSLREDDGKPIFQIIQSYEVYFMGFNIIMPDKLAINFWEDIKCAMETLTNVGFIDDDQTLYLMVSRMFKQRYNVVQSDWLMPVKEHGAEHLSTKPKAVIKKTLKDVIIMKLRIMKRNYLCSKRLKKIFFKNTLD